MKKQEILPWLNDGTISFLRSFLKKNMMVFEFGAGRSSIFFADYTKHVTSVESSFEWVEYVKSFNLPNLKVIFEQKHFSSVILNYKDGYFDLILIDSHDRLNCLKKSIRKIKNNGIILIDNCERPKLHSSVVEFAIANSLIITEIAGKREGFEWTVSILLQH